jgi:hypothetical protein
MSFSSGRRWRIGLNVCVSIVSALALVIMVNYLAARHFVRGDWSNNNPHKLSALSLHLLQSMTNQVKITVFFDKEASLFSSVSTLLNEYKLASRRIQVDYIDYLRNPGAAQLIKERYKLVGEDMDRNLVIFDSNKAKVVYEKELSDLDISRVVSGESKEVKRSTFKGELLFTSAILNVIDNRRPKAYFVSGHNELDPGNPNPKGFSKMADLCETLNIERDKVTLGKNSIPADCDLLVLAGPERKLLREELEELNRYLEQGGRFFLLLNNLDRTGLETVLSAWGVRVGDDLVFDAKSPSNISSDQTIIVTNYLTSSHPIVKPLLRSQLRIYLPRSVSQQPSSKQDPDSARVSELAASSENGVAMANIKDGVAYPDPLHDKRGAIPFIAAVEKGSVQGISADKGATRLVVAGDSLFLSNMMLDFSANRDFAVLAINWLLDRTQLMGGIAPRPVKEFQLVMTPYQMTATRWFLMAGMPGGVMLIGLVVWWRRRH